ncbi:MAG: NepR family anti-sigma factor [Alphaproteobacteria bacterium]
MRSASEMIDVRPVNDRPSKNPRGPGGKVGLDESRLRQQAIGVKLRQMFDEVVSEPVPDEFLEILRRADARRSEGA